MIRRLQHLLLLAVIFSIISQFGKHFWPSFAYISGIRVDYLSPTLYFSDILICLLFILTLVRDIRTRAFVLLKALTHKYTLLVVLLLAVFVGVTHEPGAALYGAFKVLEMTFLGYSIVNLFVETTRRSFTDILAGMVFVEGILVLWQTVIQSSVGGLWYFLGERTFSASTIGIATVTMAGNEFLRAYGSFPHPNVTAFFMLAAGMYLVLRTQNSTRWSETLFYGSAYLLSVFVLFLTFSRVTIFTFIVLMGGMAVLRIIPRKFGLFVLAASGVFIAVFHARFLPNILLSEELLFRLDLVQIALRIAREQLLLGVGLQNFYYYQLPYQREITPVLLQPVHNIYLFILAQTGLVGLSFALLFIGKTTGEYLKKLYGKSRDPFMVVSFFLFGSMLFIGLFDHFFLTVQQGQLLATVLIAFGWTRQNTKV